MAKKFDTTWEISGRDCRLLICSIPICSLTSFLSPFVASHRNAKNWREFNDKALFFMRTDFLLEVHWKSSRWLYHGFMIILRFWLKDLSKIIPYPVSISLNIYLCLLSAYISTDNEGRVSDILFIKSDTRFMQNIILTFETFGPVSLVYLWMSCRGHI